MAAAVAWLGLASAAAAQGPAARTVRVELSSCTASWFDGEAFTRALSVELVADDMRVEPDGAVALALEVPCAEDADAVITLSSGGQSRVVSLVDLAPGVRMRALALASRDFVEEVLASAEIPAPPEEPIAVETVAVEEPLASPREAAQLASPQARPEVPVARVDPPSLPQRWLAIAFSARAVWLGLRVVAPGLAIDGEARILGTPLVIWLAVDALYATGNDGLGEVRAFEVGGRVGARLVVDLAPVALSLSAGALAGYARAEGASPAVGARTGTIDGGLFGIDVSIAGSVAVTSDVRLILAVGGVGYLLGFEARAEGRPIISFRDVAPWASLGVGIDLPTD